MSDEEQTNEFDEPTTEDIIENLKYELKISKKKCKLLRQVYKELETEKEGV